MVHYKLIKVIFYALRLAEIIINVLVWHHSLPYLIITNKNSFFTLKF